MLILEGIIGLKTSNTGMLEDDCILFFLRFKFNQMDSIVCSSLLLIS